MKRSSGNFDSSSVSVILDTTVGALPRQTLPGWTFPGEIRGGGTCGWYLRVQEGVRLDTGSLSSLSTVPRVATTHWTLTGFWYWRCFA